MSSATRSHASPSHLDHHATLTRSHHLFYNTTRPPYSHCAVLLTYTLISSKVQTKTSTPLASWFGDSASTARPPPRVYSVAYARLLRQSYVLPKASRDILDLCEHLQGSWILQRAAHILPHPLAMWNRPLIPNNIRQLVDDAPVRHPTKRYVAIRQLCPCMRVIPSTRALMSLHSVHRGSDHMARIPSGHKPDILTANFCQAATCCRFSTSPAANGVRL